MLNLWMLGKQLMDVRCQMPKKPVKKPTKKKGTALERFVASRTAKASTKKKPTKKLEGYKF